MTRSLIADIGGTHARFAVVEADGTIGPDQVMRCADHAGPAQAALAFLAGQSGPKPINGAFAAASPLTGDAVEMTNSPWRFSIEGLRRDLGFERLQVVNDFTAVALSVRHLGPDHLIKLGGGEPAPGAPAAVLGPGTGLGVSGLVMGADGKWIALAGEGGHVTLAPHDDEEAQVLAVLRGRFGHVSAERVLSGPGLVNLYEALAHAAGAQPVYTTPQTISAHGLDGTCPLCRKTLAMFFAMMGGVAGNLALTLGARGGVYVAGGILPRMARDFAASEFRRRFEAKGRFIDYLAPIPAYLVVHPEPAFAGLAALSAQA